MNRVEGQVALVTGAARGQGRSHAVRLAEEGADIIAIDIADDVPHLPYRTATKEDLEETARQVEALDRRIITAAADVRSACALEAAIEAAVAELGRLDIVAANAGIGPWPFPSWELPEEQWDQMVDVNLKGVWLTCKAAIPHIIAGSRGGSIVLTSSVGSLKVIPNAAAYTAAKHGVVGLMRTLAVELAGERIRVNTVHPTQVPTPMIMNDALFRLFCPDKENPTADDFAAVSRTTNALPVSWIEPVDVSNAVLFLASDEARYITGVALPVDAGSALV
jgi:(+)-trans-carveol dehydrogenase/(-)-trans-carveol dehydrogenase